MPQFVGALIADPTSISLLCAVMLGILVVMGAVNLITRPRRLAMGRPRRLADAAIEGLAILDHGVITDANDVFGAMVGRDAAALTGQTLCQLFAPECRSQIESIATGIDQGGEADLLDESGLRRPVDVVAKPVAPADAGIMALAVRDISGRQQAARRAVEMPHADLLTGVANRLLMRDRLDQALAVSGRTTGGVAVLCLDLDLFQKIKQTPGGRIGDRLLIEIAKRLRGATRDTDTVARLDGDTFVIVQPSSKQPESAQALSQRLLRLLGEPHVIDGQVIIAPASIGVAFYPSDATAAEPLLERADQALHRAKRDGGNTLCFFEAATDARLRARRALEQDLRQSLERGELSLCYQPIFDADGLNVVAYEALLRWQSPQRGSVPPAEFIPLLEQCGLIDAIGNFVIETACMEAATWPRPIGVSINLSHVQFRQRDLPARVGDILARVGLTPDRLEIEVSEKVLIEEADRAQAMLGAFKARGVRVALDDFGTGYSALSFLRRFAFDRIKIDRSLTSQLGIAGDVDATVRAILAMSRILGLEVTAEGVETEAQLVLLRAMRCDHVQGFLLGSPVPATGIVHVTAMPAVAA